MKALLLLLLSVSVHAEILPASSGGSPQFTSIGISSTASDTRVNIQAQIGDDSAVKVSSANGTQLVKLHTSGELVLGNGAATGAKVMTAHGNIQINGSPTITAGTYHQASAAPAAFDGFAFFFSTNPVNATTEMRVGDEAGNLTTLSPHGRNGDWVFKSENTKTGKSVYVNMEDFILSMERMSGKKFIFNSEKDYYRHLSNGGNAP